MTMELPPFEPFESISRLSRSYVVTEKIDGSNGQIYISDDLETVVAGSRSRWLTPDVPDNFGFARWVAENKDELRKLGPGKHFGEWWGAGIQRRYGLTEKRFSLFNVSRWGDVDARDITKYPEPTRPACCHAVPMLGGGHSFDSRHVDEILDRLRMHGSFAAPGFMQPEGVVIWHAASRVLYKKTLEGDAHKGAKDKSAT